MTAHSPKPKRSMRAAVRLAIAAVEGRPSPLDDAELTEVNPDRTSLDLPEEEHRETCSRCGRPAVDKCSECGCPLCGDCLGLAEDVD
jgi:rubrerythrin